MSNKVYDTLKWIAQYLLPAIGALYFALANIWMLPYAEQVVGTISAIDAFLGVLLGISSMNYPGDGTMIVNTSNPDKDVFRFEANTPIEKLAEKDTLTFKVAHE